MKFSDHEIDEILRESRELQVKFEKANAELQELRQAGTRFYREMRALNGENQRLRHRIQGLSDAVARWKARAGCDDENNHIKTAQRWEYSRRTGEMGWKEYRTYTVDSTDINTLREQLLNEHGTSLLSLEAGQGSAKYTIVEWLPE